MATRNATVVIPDQSNLIIVTWPDLDAAGNDVGAGVILANYSEKCVQAYGTPTDTIIMQGSNDGETWDVLGAGVTLTIGAGGASPATRIAENPLYIRPSTPNGADMSVILIGARR